MAPHSEHTVRELDILMPPRTFPMYLYGVFQTRDFSHERDLSCGCGLADGRQDWDSAGRDSALRGVGAAFVGGNAEDAAAGANEHAAGEAAVAAHTH